MSYLDALDKIIDDFGKHRLTDVMEEENEEDGRFSRNNNRKRYSSNSSAILTEDTDSFIIGQKVWVSGTKPGHIAFIGETQFAPGEWAGIALDEPIGKNDGSVGGIRYFQCEPKKGVFARLTRLTRFPLVQEDMGSGDTFTSASPVGQGVRSAVSPTGSTRGALKSPTSIIGSNVSLTSAASHVLDYKIGDRVIIKSSQGSKVGTVKFIGITEFANGEWVGVELDEPRGKNDGSVNGKRYFECRPGFGIFAPTSKVSKSPSKIKPNACQIHSLGLPPSGILRRTNSKESLLSNLSVTSAASSVRRVRLGVTSLTPKKVTPKSTSTPIPTRTALQDVLKEKQLHIEQLLKERDLERAEITKAANQAEEAEQRLSTLRQESEKYRTECEIQLQEHINLLNKLKENRNELVVQLDEEKRKTEDLSFRLAESSIFKEDVEKNISAERIANEIKLQRIKELEEKLQKERDKVENLESDANKLFEAEENLIKAKEEIESLRKQLQDTRNKQIVLEGDTASTSVLIVTLQKEIDQYKCDLEERNEVIHALKHEMAKVSADLRKQIEDTMNQKTDIETLCGTKDEEINRIKLELNQVSTLLQNKIIELEKISNEKLTSDTAFEKEIDKLKMELSSKIFDLENISKTNTEKESEIMKLQEQLDLAKTKIEVNNAELEKLKTDMFKQISERNQLLEESQQQNSKMQEEVRNLTLELENNKLVSEAAIADIEKKFNKHVEEKNHNITEINLQFQETLRKNVELSKAYDEFRNKFETKCCELDSLRIQNENVINEFDALQMRLVELQKDSDTLKDKNSLIQSLQTELQTTRVDLESVTSNLLQYQTNMTDVESTLKTERDEIKDSLKAKIFELEEAKKVFSESISQKDDQLRDLSGNLAKKSEETEKLQKELESFKKKNAEYIDEIINTHLAENKNKEEQLIDLLDKIDSKTKQVCDSENEITDLKEKLAQRLLDYQKLNEEMESKINQNTSQSTIIIETKDELEQLKKSKEQLEVRCKDLEQIQVELEELNMKRQEELDTRLNEINQNEVVIKLKDNEILKLKAEVADMRETLEQTTKDLGIYQNNLNDVNANFKKENDEVQKSLEARNLELDEIKQKMNEHVTHLEKSLAESNSISEKKSQEILDLNKRNNDLWTEIKKISNKTFNFFNETTLEDDDISVLSYCVVKWEEHYNQQKDEVHKLREELEKLSDQFKLVDNNALEFQQQLAKLTEVNDETKKLFNESDNAVKTLTDDNEKLKVEMNNMVLVSRELSDNTSSLMKQLEEKEQALTTFQSQYNRKIDDLQETVKQLQDKKDTLEITMEKQKNEYEQIIKTISESESALKNEVESKNDAEKINDLEVKLSQTITKLGQKDMLIASQNEEIVRTKEELEKIMPQRNGFIQKLEDSAEPNSDQTNENPEYQQLLEEKVFAENQVAFLNSIIADMQKKNEQQQARIEILEMGYNAAAADELASLGFTRDATIPPPRMYCDICEEFDLHETEDCPTQGDDEPPSNRQMGKQLMEKPPPRSYCEICEEFGHATEDCTNMDQEF